MVLNNETEVFLCISAEQEKLRTVIHFYMYTGLKRRSRTVSEETYSRAATHQEVSQFSTKMYIHLHFNFFLFLFSVSISTEWFGQSLVHADTRLYPQEVSACREMLVRTKYCPIFQKRSWGLGTE